MPKMKTKSGVKKRFSLTSKGKVRANQAGKQHNMRRRQKSAIRNLRGTTVLKKCDENIVKQFMPYG